MVKHKKSGKESNKAAAKAPVKAPRLAPRQVRIIGGDWKRTPLPVLEAEGLRPTPDRVRETVFNWLNHLLHGNWQGISCLDLFAGTGALGFEAASRGARRVLMVESHTPVVRQLQMISEKLLAEQVEIVRGDATAVANVLLAKGLERFDVIFLDPPYHQDWLGKMLPVCAQLLTDNGLIYVEAEFALGQDSLPDWLAGWEIARADRAGMVYFHLLQRKRGA